MNGNPAEVVLFIAPYTLFINEGLNRLFPISSIGFENSGGDCPGENIRSIDDFRSFQGF
jgi:hypothetical protein